MHKHKKTPRKEMPCWIYLITILWRDVQLLYSLLSISDAMLTEIKTQIYKLKRTS